MKQVFILLYSLKINKKLKIYLQEFKFNVYLLQYKILFHIVKRIAGLEYFAVNPE